MGTEVERLGALTPGSDHDSARAGEPAKTWPPVDPGREALTREEAAALMGISPITLRNWGGYQHGPVYFKDGRKVFYRRADVEAWIANRPGPRRAW